MLQLEVEESGISVAQLLSELVLRHPSLLCRCMCPTVDRLTLVLEPDHWGVLVTPRNPLSLWA
jgi:hypothetical protein